MVKFYEDAIRCLLSFDLSYSDRWFWLLEGLCSVCASPAKWRPKMSSEYNIVKISLKSQKLINLLYNIVRNDEIWCFWYNPKNKSSNCRLEPTTRGQNQEMSLLDGKSKMQCWFVFVFQRLLFTISSYKEPNEQWIIFSLCFEEDVT